MTERRSSTGYPGTPLWVKVGGIIALALIVLVVVIMVLGGGSHGPSRHFPSGIGWFVIVPMALAALLTGLVIALGTHWGLFRHYWVLASLALTVLATAVLVLHMPSVSALADVVRRTEGVALSGGHGGDLFHAAWGLLVLLGITVLNVYKPQGLTPYGWRKQQEDRAPLSDSPSREAELEISNPMLAASRSDPSSDR